ncbi:MAG TPA: hypothetical protein VJA16_07815 [Thermoanaerobaculia bacterium]
MNLQRSPFLVGLAAVAILVLRGPAQPLPGPPAASQAANPVLAALTQAGASGAETGKPGQPAALAISRAAAARRTYARLYRELLGIETPQPPPAAATKVHGTLAGQSLNLEISNPPSPDSISDADLDEIARIARKSCYRLEFMIALASDPIESGLASDFDLTMSALQIGLADAGYRLDGQWLPWVDADAADKKTYRDAAGIMLFRRQSPSASDHHLLAVFVVGETFKVGIHKTAFENAVQFILALHGRDKKLAPSSAPDCVASRPASPEREAEIPILGPSSSGSATSLRVALAHAPKGWFRIVSGSASAPGLKEQLEARLGDTGVRVWFSRTVVPDDELARKGLGFLQGRLGWDLDKAALLVERDTAYGSYFSGLATNRRANPLLARLTRLTFPSGLYALRNAWEASAASAPPAQAIASNPQAFATPKTALDVSLADQRTPVDVVPELSPLTARIYDMALADLLREISREGYSYIGILATDVKDQLFLAEQIRRWAPSVILFVVDNNLLYVHPQYNTATFGMLTISSFPLVTEGRLPVASPSNPDPRVRRQFASERQEGTYLAVRTILGQAPASRPAVWISASGNYAMWPLATIPARLTEDESPPQGHSGDVKSLGPQPPAPVAPDKPANAVKGGGASLDQHRPMARPREGMDLALVFLAFVACMVSVLLQRETRDWAATQPRTLVLLSCATALLVLAGAFLVGLWFVKLLPDLSPQNRWDLSACLPLALLASGYVYLAWALLATRYPYPLENPLERVRVVSIWLRRPDGTRTRREPGLVVAIWFVVLVLPFALTWTVFWLWQVGGPGFAGLRDAAGLFYLRARVFSGGISPVIPLAWLAAACFFWLVVELQRQWVRRRHDPSSPDSSSGAPSLELKAEPEATWPLRHYSDPAFKSCQVGSERIGSWLRPTLPPGRGKWLAILAIVGPPITFLWPRIQPIGETRAYGLVFLVLAAGLSTLSTMTMLRFLRVWAHLRAMLHRIERTDLLPALKAVAAEIGWQPTHFSWYEPSFTAVKSSAERLQRMIDWRLIDQEQIVDPGDRHRQLPDLLEAIFTAACAQRFAEEVSLRDALNARCDRACKLLADQSGRQSVKEFYAVRLIAYLRHVFHQLRYSVLGAMGCGLALIVGTSTYAFQPKEFATLVLWGTLAVASAALLMVFLQMERDTTLSAIGRTDAGKVTYDWHFLSKLLIYSVPVVGLILSQFPSAGRLFNSLIDPLLRVVGTG